ncbi:thiaminase II [Tropicimonas marinistellae]|uniref:thiaminase II n=1 Tax=Tropicimonas marinistellae TaxID=1739787 RepID=UPI000832D4E3|nr:thiaminase II [Tropicimonas marinistellae]
MNVDTGEYGRAFGLWRRAAGQEWAAYVAHPFVTGLGDGSLPRESFLHYLVQDYVFLVHFARAWALAVVKAETLEEMRVATATVDALVREEMALHISVCAREGISEDMLYQAAESPANLAYTRYVLDAGSAGDFADLMAALAPCVLGYGEIGLLLSGVAAPDTPYREWIDTYAGEDYQETCRQVGSMIDIALERRIGADFDAAPRWPRLIERFVTATRLEVGFWQMGWDRA